MTLERSLVEELPSVQQVRNRLGDALREVELLRKLLPIAERAEEYRQADEGVAREQ